MIKKLFVMFFLFILTSANASKLEQLKLEAELEKRLTLVVSTWDPIATVTVKAEFNKITSTLPGLPFTSNPVSSNVVESSSLTQLKGLSVVVKGIQVELPAHLKENLLEKASFAGVEVTFNYSAINKENLSKNQLQLLEQAEGKSAVAASNSFSLFEWSLIASIILAFIVGLLNSKRSRNFWSSEISRLSKSIEEQDVSSSMASSPMQAQESVQYAAAQNFSEHDLDNIQQMSVASCVEVLADLYWAGSDEQASWFWKQLNLKLQQQCLDAWPVLKSYVQSISGLSAIAFQDYNNPVYLNPLGAYELSNKDLQRLVLKNLEIYNRLSSVRRGQMHFDFAQQMKILERSDVAQIGAGVGFEKLFKDEKASTLRDLSHLTQEQFYLSEAEEAALLENIDTIPANKRSNFATLVWLALCPDDVQTELLMSVSVEDLASAWVGEASMLNSLALKLPERRQKYLNDYLKRAKPSKNSSYIAISKAALKALENATNNDSDYNDQDQNRAA